MTFISSITTLIQITMTLVLTSTIRLLNDLTFFYPCPTYSLFTQQLRYHVNLLTEKNFQWIHITFRKKSDVLEMSSSPTWFGLYFYLLPSSLFANSAAATLDILLFFEKFKFSPPQGFWIFLFSLPEYIIPKLKMLSQTSFTLLFKCCFFLLIPSSNLFYYIISYKIFLNNS